MTFERLVRALVAERQLAAWSARGTHVRAAWLVRGAEPGRGERVTTALAATVHRDLAAGRGSASFTLDPGGSLPDALAAALVRAGAAVGPAWRSPPPAAPARVTVADPELSGADLGATAAAIADDVAAAARAAGAEVVEVAVEVELESVRTMTRQGLDARWPASRLRVEATLARGEVMARLERTARRRADLEIGVAVADVVSTAERRRRAQAPPVGRLPVVLRAPALAHGGRGLLEALVTQADPALERQGLVRYRPGQPIVPGAAMTAQPLTVVSDGTLPFGLRSAPLDHDGAAIRRFELVGKGVARGLGLDGREAALRGQSPNGGVRGLVVGPGLEDEAGLTGDGPLLIVEAWSWLELVPVTGQFRAAIALGHLRDRDQRHDVTGGVVRGDALTALALSRRSRERVTLPEYQGPALWHLGELAIDGVA